MIFTKETVIRASPDRVFAFHELPDALERLIPPWQNARIIEKADITKVGSRAIIDLKILRFFTERWVAEHTAYDPPHYFEDVQVDGPFKNWRHGHFVKPHAEGSLLRDEIDYLPPFGLLGLAAVNLVIEPDLEKMFAYRHEVTRIWCETV